MAVLTKRKNSLKSKSNSKTRKQYSSSGGSGKKPTRLRDKAKVAMKVATKKAKQIASSAFLTIGSPLAPGVTGLTPKGFASRHLRDIHGFKGKQIVKEIKAMLKNPNYKPNEEVKNQILAISKLSPEYQQKMENSWRTYVKSGESIKNKYNRYLEEASTGEKKKYGIIQQITTRLSSQQPQQPQTPQSPQPQNIQKSFMDERLAKEAALVKSRQLTPEQIKVMEEQEEQMQYFTRPK